MTAYIKTILKWTITNYIACTLGGFFAVTIAGFTPYFSGIFEFSGELSPLFEIYWNTKLILVSSSELALLVTCIVSPFYLFVNYFSDKYYVHILIWTIVGFIFGNYQFKYIYGDDYSGFIMAPYGLYCGLLSVPVHRKFWKTLPRVIPFFKRLHEIQVTR